jgi:hypothetical protein
VAASFYSKITKMSNKQNTRLLILAYLKEFPNLDCRELAEAFNMRADTMRDKHIKPLREEREIYISGYLIEPGHQIACYSVGNRKDAEKKLCQKYQSRQPRRSTPKPVVRKAGIVPIPKPEVNPLIAFALGYSQN